MSTKEKLELGGIRLWRGFTAESWFPKRPAFFKALRQIFIPQTAQQMYPLGLHAYFPALVPKTDVLGQVTLPDEVALVIYPSQSAYENATSTNVAGRAYGLLHSAVFNFSQQSAIPASNSQVPEPWPPNWKYGRAYSLTSECSDWQQGQTRVLLATIPEASQGDAFEDALNQILKDWQDSAKLGIEAAIILVEPTYVLYWENSAEADGCHSSSLIPRLQELLEAPLLNSTARVIEVPPAFTLPDDGVECEAGELLSLITSQ